jgi:Methyltransferase domain
MWTRALQKEPLMAIASLPSPGSPEQIFRRIYAERLWGTGPDASHPFYSGCGSHDADVVSPYLEAVRHFLCSFETRPDAADLGCGDFSIGSRVRPFCANYIACDVVPELIDFNRKRFQCLEVDFRTVDLIVDPLPQADVVFVRQVFQHLSNKQILRAMARIGATYRYLVLTEHLPAEADFEHNLDKPAGPDIRPAIGSGIVLGSEPFKLRASHERELCRVPQLGGLIVTTLYRFT